MKGQIFLLQLLAIITVSLCIIWICDQNLDIYRPFVFGGSLILFLSALTCLILFVGQILIKQKNRTLFLQLVIVNTFLKMLLCCGIAAIHHHLSEIRPNRFIIPLVLIYLLFTVYETYVLLKVNASHRENPA